LHIGRKCGIGDVLLCTPTLRRLKEVNPGCRLTFYTESTSLLEGLSFIDEVRSYDEAPPGIIDLRYEESIPPWRHLARIIGDTIGVDVRDVRPACVVKAELKEDFLRTWGELPRPWVVVNRHASGWTPNKDWPAEHWEVLVDRLQTWATVLEIGSTRTSGGRFDSDRYVNLTGQLSLDQLVAALAGSDLNVGPISGPVHIAAAVGVPSVVVYGGYEPPVCTHYPGNIDLYSKIECAPCWLREPCPFERKCLTRISPDVVETSLRQLWHSANPVFRPASPSVST
jgi:ADP-heptose:LPS heptosyltransferase